MTDDRYAPLRSVSPAAKRVFARAREQRRWVEMSRATRDALGRINQLHYANAQWQAAPGYRTTRTAWL
jgi:hypothetical protein